MFLIQNFMMYRQNIKPDAKGIDIVAPFISIE